MHSGIPATVSNASRPWETVALDTVSAKASKEGYCKILTVLDTFSRYVITAPLKTTTAEEVSKSLMHNLFCVFGRPDTLLTDDGSEFLNSALRSLNKRWGIHHHSTGGYQPHSNPVERYHRYLNSAMTTLSMQFGDDWPSYLPAATFAYNASTNDATGYSPYELIMAKGSPVLLQHIDLHSIPAAGPKMGKSATEFYKDAGDRIMAAYTHVREQQQRISRLRNEAIMARRGTQQKKPTKFEVGDNVLYWEPRQSILAMEAADATGHWQETPPAKWTYNWSGPHQIIERTPDPTGFRYTFYHERRRATIVTHVNKLVVFEPWSVGIMSTSLGIDARRNYRAGEWAEPGQLIIVPMVAPEPFGVGRIINHSPEGDINVQWHANATNSPFHPYLPGWIDRLGGKYYEKEPRVATDKAYTSIDDGIDIHQCDVAIHSFQLTESYKIPPDVLRAVAANPLIWWTKTDAELSATEMAWDAARTAGTEAAHDRDQQDMNSSAAEIRDKGENDGPEHSKATATNTDAEADLESPPPSSPDSEREASDTEQEGALGNPRETAEPPVITIRRSTRAKRHKANAYQATPRDARHATLSSPDTHKLRRKRRPGTATDAISRARTKRTKLGGTGSRPADRGRTQ